MIRLWDRFKDLKLKHFEKMTKLLGTMAVQADTRNNPGLFSAYGG